MSGRKQSEALPARTPWARWVLIAGLTCGVCIPAGVGLAAIIGRAGEDTLWARWGTVGEAFGVINSLLSALTLAALVITYTLQSRDLQLQQADIKLQRLALENAESALRRSADVDSRNLHVRLMQMAIEDPHLAEVLPSHGETSAATQRQYLFANLLLQNVWLHHTAGNGSEEELAANLRRLFASLRMREYWKETTAIREGVYVDGAKESELARITDRILHEYEAP